MLPILGQITNARFFTLANNFTSAKLNWMNRTQTEPTEWPMTKTTLTHWGITCEMTRKKIVRNFLKPLKGTIIYILGRE